MGFSIYCIIEACLLMANAIAILNDRFLKKWGFHVDNMNHNQPVQEEEQGADNLAK
jgi:hypothetical protein